MDTLDIKIPKGRSQKRKENDFWAGWLIDCYILTCRASWLIDWLILFWLLPPVLCVWGPWAGWLIDIILTIAPRSLCVGTLSWLIDWYYFDYSPQVSVSGDLELVDWLILFWLLPPSSLCLGTLSWLIDWYYFDYYPQFSVSGDLELVDWLIDIILTIAPSSLCLGTLSWLMDWLILFYYCPQFSVSGDLELVDGLILFWLLPPVLCVWGPWAGWWIDIILTIAPSSLCLGTLSWLIDWLILFWLLSPVLCVWGPWAGWAPLWAWDGVRVRTQLQPHRVLRSRPHASAGTEPG